MHFRLTYGLQLCTSLRVAVARSSSAVALSSVELILLGFEAAPISLNCYFSTFYDRHGTIACSPFRKMAI